LKSQHKIKEKKELERKMWEEELEREKERIRRDRANKYVQNGD
jgi:hypothetical protein